MAVQLLHHVMRVLPELRFRPTLKHLTVRLGSELVAQTGHAMLVWEPKRVVPAYAVPQRDVSASLTPRASAGATAMAPVSLGDGPPVLDPRTGFGAHTTGGEALVTGSALAANAAFRPRRSGPGRLPAAGFRRVRLVGGRPADHGSPAGPVPSDRRAGQLTTRQAGTPRGDPRRVGPAAAAVRGSVPDGAVLPATARREGRSGTERAGHGVRLQGQGDAYTAVAAGQELPDIAWSYEDPLLDATGVKGSISFYQERLDVFVDGRPVERPRTPWS